MRIFKRVLLVVLVLVVVVIAGFSIWAYTPLGPMPEAVAALESSTTVTVSRSPWLTFTPTGQQPTTGLIVYPGGRVDYRSYAPLARAIAERGYLVTIVPMPFNLAVMGTNKADAVIAAHPEIDKWAIGGHSLGGAMSVVYAYKKPDAVDAVALWAAYPPGNTSLAERDVPVTSIFGTKDGLSTPAKIEQWRQLLPSGTVWVPIEGGNHGQFGNYGAQPGDGEATITREEQQSQVVNATVDLLESLGK